MWCFYLFLVLVGVTSLHTPVAVRARARAPVSPTKIHHSNTPHVAFVFAGSARSFTEHFVHESIRVNLIHSFCVPRHCHGVLFFRVSLIDNVHQDVTGNTIADGSGRMVPADPTITGEVITAMHRLAKVPHLNYSIPVVTTWAHAPTSSLEKTAIMEEFPSVRSKIFTLLDSRRYSMYYNRYKSFMQVPSYEKMHNIEFQWVVHVRLDAIWGEPVQPVFFWNSLGADINHRYDTFPTVNTKHQQSEHSHQQHPSEATSVDDPGSQWKDSSSNTTNINMITDINSNSNNNNNRVWVVDTWYDDVPDTFALLPRAFAAQYFDLEAFSADGVMCLGGPNVNHEAVTSPDYLITALNFSSLEVNEVKAVVCRDEEEGGSEKILKRKLEYLGITLDKGTLGYQTFFTAIVRPGAAEDMCFYLEQHRLIGWVWPRQYSSEAVYPACVMLMSLVRLYRDQIRTSLQQLTSASTPQPANGTRIPGTKTWTATATATVIAPLSENRAAITDGLFFNSDCMLDTSVGEYKGAHCPLTLPSDRFYHSQYQNHHYHRDHASSSSFDWNFMPFRLHIRKKCLTLATVNEGDTSADTGTSTASDTSIRFALRPCVTSIAHGSDWNSTYSPLQLFHFFPRLHTAQPIMLMHRDKLRCLTVVALSDDAVGVGKGTADVGVNTNTKQQQQQVVSEAVVRLQKCSHDKQLHRHGREDQTGTASNQRFLIKVLQQQTHAQLQALHDAKGEFIVGQSGSGSNIDSGSAGTSTHSSASTRKRLPTGVIAVSIAHVSESTDLSLLQAWFEGRVKTDTENGKDTASFSRLSCLALLLPRRSNATTATSTTARTTTTSSSSSSSSTYGFVSNNASKSNGSSGRYSDGDGDGDGDGLVLKRCDPMDASQIIMIERTTTVAWVKYIRKVLEYQHYIGI